MPKQPPPLHDRFGASARLLAAGQGEQAIALLRRAVADTPQAGEAHFRLGEALVAVGRLSDALAALDRSVALRPASWAAQFKYGQVLEQLGRFGPAADAYRAAIALKPREADTHLRLAIALQAQNKLAEAADAFLRAASLSPKTTAGRLAHAYGLIALGQPEEALVVLRQAVALDPANAAAWSQLGQLEAEAGHAGAAEYAFEKSVRDPAMAARYYDLVRIRRQTDTDKGRLDAMRTALARPALHPLSQVMLHLALAKASGDLDDIPEAAGHMLRANRLKGTIRPLDRAAMAALIDWQITTFASDFLARAKLAAAEPPMPLLIVGMPRSGTTLIESILSRHDDVTPGQELQFWNREGRRIASPGKVPDAREIAAAATAYSAMLRALGDTAYVTDKKPDNFLWCGLVHLCFPQARIVHCRRAPAEVFLSIAMNFFAPRPDFSTEPDDLLFYYGQYRRLMAHWRAVLPPDRFVEVDYEMLTANPEPQIARLVQACGLRWSDGCLRPEESARRVNTASLWQIRRPIGAPPRTHLDLFRPHLGSLADRLDALNAQEPG